MTTNKLLRLEVGTRTLHDQALQLQDLQDQICSSGKYKYNINIFNVFFLIVLT